MDFYRRSLRTQSSLLFQARLLSTLNEPIIICVGTHDRNAAIGNCRPEPPSAFASGNKTQGPFSSRNGRKLLRVALCEPSSCLFHQWPVLVKPLSKKKSPARNSASRARESKRFTAALATAPEDQCETAQTQKRQRSRLGHCRKRCACHRDAAVTRIIYLS